MIQNKYEQALLNSPVRKIDGYVELYEGSTYLDRFNKDDNLIGFTVERVGEESKFFGFGICQKLNVHLLDVNREININTGNCLRPAISAGNSYVSVFPRFKVTEVHRDENTNELSITAYDDIYFLNNYTFSDLADGLFYPYTLYDLLLTITGLLNNDFNIVGVPEENNPFYTEYTALNANFEGTENFRDILTAIAEVTQTIYYIDNNNWIVFKRLDMNGEPQLTITKEDYIELDSKTNRRLTAVVSATELGDNIGASMGQTGSTQYIRNNPFWELREDLASLVDNALAAVGGMSINQFNCSWRGNHLLEPGDKLALVTKDNNTVISYLLNDSLNYNGGMSQKTSWSYTDGEGEHSNPTSLGDTLRQTYAKVDKVNKEISIVVNEAASLRVTTDGINSYVSKIDDNIAELTNAVNTKISAEDITITVENILADGAVDEVTTATGFTFNSEGLHISQTDSEMGTSITENGMEINKNNKVVLTVDNQGVKAEDLHATTYLIIGTNSRFENYGSNRTGCFWIAN